MEAIYSFVSPMTGDFNFGLTSVDAQNYPLSDGVIVCVREATSEACIANGRLDQLRGIRDGRWQRALSAVPLTFNTSYEFSLKWDPLRGGYVAADALLVESVALYNGDDSDEAQSIGSSVVLGPMDSRIWIKKNPASGFI